jgi:sucrose synthase
MRKLIQAILDGDERQALRRLVDTLRASRNHYFLRNDILQAFTDGSNGQAYHSSSLSQLMHYTHEMILAEDSIWLVVRPWIASQQVWRLPPDLASAIGR